VERAKTIISSITRGCVDAGCALIGGETAEMPGFYNEEEYDLAGFGVGVVDSDKIIDGSRISAKDVIIGLHSSGLHSNGFSLVRKVLFDRAKMGIDLYIDDIGRSLAEELLIPTRIYVKSVLNILRGFEIKGIVNITGGGFIDNIPRVLPARSSAVIERGSWTVPPIFRFIQDIGKIEDPEMYRTFNMGIGMALIVSSKDADDVMLRLKGLKETTDIIGFIESRVKGGESVILS
jgi:phosphoribosylformylglycinamidine cyclo-ligase